MVHLKDSNERLHGLEFVFIELEKFKARNIAQKKLQVLWLRFMTEINERTETIDPELLAQPEIQKAINFVMEASLSKEEKHLYEKNWDRISSEKTLLSAALAEGWVKGKEEGREEGREEGKYREKREIAKRLKKSGMSPAEIAGNTGLSNEEIEKM